MVCRLFRHYWVCYLHASSKEILSVSLFWTVFLLDLLAVWLTYMISVFLLLPMTSLLPLPLGSLVPLLFLLFSPFALLLTLSLTFLNVNFGLKASQLALTLSSLIKYLSVLIRSYSVLPLILTSLAVTYFNNTMRQPCIGLTGSLHTLSPINLLIVCLFLWSLLVTTTSRWHAICVPLEVVHLSMRVGLSWIPLLLCYTWSFTFPWPFSQLSPHRRIYSSCSIYIWRVQGISSLSLAFQFTCQMVTFLSPT